MSQTLSDLAKLEAALKIDLFQTLGTPVLTLLQSEQTALSQPGIDGVASLQTAWLVFLGQIPLSLPKLEFMALQALNSFAITKLTSLMQQASAAQTAPAKTA